MTDYQHQANVRRLEELRKKGYQFAISADGYSVFFNEVFLGGASVKLPRSKPLHWRHRVANIKSNVEQALLTVDRAKCQIA